MTQTNKPSDIKKMKKLKKGLNDAPVLEGTVPLPADPAKVEAAADEAAKLETLAVEHAKMWEGLDGKSPFEWPEDARNLYQSGCTCSLWGRSPVDMTREQLILFIAYVDTVASDLHGQCQGLAMAMEQVAKVRKGRKRLFRKRK